MGKVWSLGVDMEKRWLGLGCVLALAGCANALELKDIRPILSRDDPSQFKGVSGLREALDGSPSAPIRVMTVHGMITARPEYSKTTQAAIAARLNLEPGPVERVVLNRGYGLVLFDGDEPIGELPQAPSSVTRTQWVDRAGDPRLIFYELFWAPLRDEMKYTFLGCFESRSLDEDRARADPGAVWTCDSSERAEPNLDPRSLLNAGIKDGLMVRGFADAMIASGRVGEVLKDDVSLTACIMAVDALSDKRSQGSFSRLEDFQDKRCALSTAMSDMSALETLGVLEGSKTFAITESLGSYLFLAAQRARRTDVTQPSTFSADSIAFSVFDQATIYMFANQVALLNLGDIEPVCIPRAAANEATAHNQDDQSNAMSETPEDERALAPFQCPNPRLRRNGDVKEGGPIFLSRSATYVAFNDADDVLGFELPPYLNRSGAARALVNVSVRNPALGVPFLFRWFDDVHTNQARNDAIITAIVDGLPAQPAPRP